MALTERRRKQLEKQAKEPPLYLIHLKDGKGIRGSGRKRLCWYGKPIYNRGRIL